MTSLQLTIFFGDRCGACTVSFPWPFPPPVFAVMQVQRGKPWGFGHMGDDR